MCGCVEWKRTGSLGEPEIVKQAVAEYRDQQDILHDFLVERCLFKKSERIDQAELYKAYKAWCEENDAYVVSKPYFTHRMREKGAIAGKRGGNKSVWQGIRLLTDAERVTRVTGGIDFPQSFLHEASTGKPLEKINNSDNSTNPTADDVPPYPAAPCPKCGSEWAMSPKGQYICEKCGFPRASPELKKKEEQEIDMEV